MQQKREDDLLAEQKRRGQILKEKIWPLLKSEDQEVEKAKIFLQVFEMALQQGHVKTRTTMNVADLKLEEEIKNDPQNHLYHDLFAILNGEKVDVALDLVKSMNQIIENHLKEENKIRKVSELKLKYFEDAK